MAEISRVALFGKLNGVAYRVIEAATVFCKMRGNPYMELGALVASNSAAPRQRRASYR